MVHYYQTIVIVSPMSDWQLDGFNFHTNNLNIYL